MDTTSSSTTKTATTIPSETCGGPGWRRVAFINMTDPNQDCPRGFNLTDYHSVRSCGRSHPELHSCSSVTFPTDGPQYSQVCGRATAYRWAYNYAFFGYHRQGFRINGAYVDGLSLTHGSPRTHIWTFASGSQKFHRFDLNCPCETNNTYASPSFVGNNYFCEFVNSRNNAL